MRGYEVMGGQLLHLYFCGSDIDGLAVLSIA